MSLEGKFSSYFFVWHFLLLFWFILLIYKVGRDAQEVCRIWLKGCWVVLPRPSLQDWQCRQLMAFSLVSLGELPSAGESHLAQDYFLRAAHFLGWVNIGVLRQGSLLQFGTILKEHPSSRAPRGMGWGLCCDCLKVHLLASLPHRWDPRRTHQ